MVASLAGRELSEDQRKQYGQAIHWALGAGAGALYGALRPRSDVASAAGGVANTMLAAIQPAA